MPDYNYLVNEGMISAQPTIGEGRTNSVLTGLNVLFESGNVNRLLRPPLDISEPLTVTTYGFTATVALGNPVVTMSSTPTGIVKYQTINIDGVIYVVKGINGNDVTVSPTPASPATAGAGKAVKTAPKLYAVDSDRGSIAHGSVILFRNHVYVVTGIGQLTINGVTITGLIASDTPQIYYNGTVAPVGFTAPTAPVVSKGTSAAHFEGGAVTRAVYRAKKRKGYDGSGLISPPTLVTFADGEYPIVTLDTFDSSQGQNQWVVLMTKHYDTLMTQPYIAGVFDTATGDTGSSLDQNDNLLVRQYDDDNYPPEKAHFAFGLEDNLCLASCLGAPDGSGVATAPGTATEVSRRGNPEAFPIAGRSETTPSEDIIGVQVAQYAVYLMSTNRIHTGSLAGSEVRALVTRPGRAIAMSHQDQACVIEDALFVKSGNDLIETTSPEQERQGIGLPIYDVLSLFPDERTFTCLDGKAKLIVVICSNYQKGSGGKWQSAAVCYNFNEGKWSTLCLLGDGTTSDFTVTGRCTCNNQLYLATADGKTWKWDQGSGTVSWALGWPFNDAGGRSTMKTVTAVTVVGGATTPTAQIYRNNDIAGLVAGSGSIQKQLTAGVGSPAILPTWKPNIKGRSFAIRLSGSDTAGTHVCEGVQVLVEHDDMEVE